MTDWRTRLDCGFFHFLPVCLRLGRSGEGGVAGGSNAYSICIVVVCRGDACLMAGGERDGV